MLDQRLIAERALREGDGMHLYRLECTFVDT